MAERATLGTQKGHWVPLKLSAVPWEPPLVDRVMPREDRSVFRSLVIAPRIELRRVGAAVADPASRAAERTEVFILRLVEEWEVMEGIGDAGEGVMRWTAEGVSSLILIPSVRQ